MIIIKRIFLLFLLSLAFIKCYSEIKLSPENFEDKKVGGQSEIDVNDVTVDALLKENLQRIGESENLKLLKKTKITQQVVAGIAYQVTGLFKIGKLDSECVISIWIRPWLSDPSEKVKIKVECGETVYRTKGETSEW
jgi:hypothetical protein